MTTSNQTEGPKSAPDIAAAMRLRPDPPRVVRLSRRVLGGGAALVAAGIGAMLIVALQSRQRETTPELYRTENPQMTDELTRLPRDYSDLPRKIPQLGPRLPGDLGRPILHSQEQGRPFAPPPLQPLQADPEEQRRLAEIEAARTSALFVETQGADTTLAPAALSSGSFAVPTPGGPASTSDPMATDRRQAFLDAPVDRRTLSPDRISAPASPFFLQAGTIIPAALMTGIRSDLPGQITAQVTQPVYDSPTGRYLLVPQGARLIGTYDADIGAGQSRILLVWTRLILPGGRSIILENLPGADRQGQAGLEDGVDDHWDRVFRAAGLATLIGVAGELVGDTDDPVASAIRDSAQATVGSAGERIVERQLDLPPTLTIRPGYPLGVIVTRDLVLEPLGG